MIRDGNGHYRSAQGIGLPELLISLFLACLITLSLINIHLNVKKEYSYAQDRLDGEVDVLGVIELMRDSIRRAGFTPCLNLDQLTSYDSRTQKYVLPSMVLNSQHQSSLDVYRMSEQFTSRVKIDSNTQIKLEESLPWVQKNKSILIANCFFAEVHEVSEVHHHHQDTTIILNTPLRFDFETEAYVGEWIEERYYIHTQQTAALYYQFHHADELTRVIHAMKVQKIMVKEAVVIDINLGIKNGKEIHFSTAIRG